MNIRQFLHTVVAVCSALAAGTYVIPGVPSEVVPLFGLVAMAISIFMGSTTTGVAKE